MCGEYQPAFLLVISPDHFNDGSGIMGALLQKKRVHRVEIGPTAIVSLAAAATAKKMPPGTAFGAWTGIGNGIRMSLKDGFGALAAPESRLL